MVDFFNINPIKFTTSSFNKAPITPVPANNYTNNSQNPNNINLVDKTYGRIALQRANYADSQKMYSELYNFLDTKGKDNLNKLSKNGKLLSKASNDSSTTVENLYKIMKTKRAQEFDAKKIISETLNTLVDPYITTQNVGKIPEDLMKELITNENKRVQEKFNTLSESAFTNSVEKREQLKIITRQDIDFHYGHSCPGASIEFDLADKKPAEFVRYVEGLTSPEKVVKTKIKYSNIAPNMPEAIALLTDQKTEFKTLGWQDIEVSLRADPNAYLRANIQEDHRVKDSRSVVDVLLQSAFMNIGSSQTYNSLTDLRSEETGDGMGLSQFEIAFVESIVDFDEGKESVSYMQLNNNLTKVEKYFFDPQTTKKQLVDSLACGKNIIVGFLTDIDSRGNLETPNGHEVLLTDIVTDEKGVEYFKYNDTDDDDHYAPSYIKADELINSLHHANLPKKIASEYFSSPEDLGYVYLQDYLSIKNPIV